MKLSSYIQTYEVEPGIIGAYSPFDHAFTFLPTSQWSALEHGELQHVPEGVLDDLVRRKFLVGDDFERHVLDHHRPPEEGIREMWLVLVQGCNMTCQYCVVEGNVESAERRVIGGGAASHGGSQREAAPTAGKVSLPVLGQSSAHDGSAAPQGEHEDMMSPEVAAAAVEKFAAYLQDTRPPFPRVTLYGGEPLLNPRTIRHVVPLIRAISFPGQLRPDPVQILLITNGQIYTESMQELFIKYRVTVSVSLDGMKHHHDAVRVTSDGSGTWDKAVESLKRYQDAGIQTGICTTIGTHNVDDLPDIADYFAETFGTCVEFQVPFDIPFNGRNKFYMNMADAAPKALEAFRRLRARGMLEGLAARRLIQIARGQFHHRDCSAVGGQMVVAPDGMMGPCHSLVGERRFFAGSVQDSESHPHRMSAFQEWSRRVPVNMPDCHGCPAIGICGGGCPYNALINRGSIWAKDPQQCQYMYYTLDWLIADTWERYKATNLNRAPQTFAAPPLRDEPPHRKGQKFAQREAQASTVAPNRPEHESTAIL